MPAKMAPQRLAQVAFWYYIEDRSEGEIGERLGLSRSNVSRILTAAREQGIIRFEIDYPLERDKRLEKGLYDRFAGTSLREVIVASVGGAAEGSPDGEGGPEAAILAVAQAGVNWLATSLRDGMTVGLSWGSVTQTLVDVAHFEERRNVHVVQLAGEASLDSRHSGHNLVRDLAARIGGSYTYFDAPAAGRSARDGASLLRSPQVSAALARARSADVSLLGVGAYNVGSSKVFLAQAEATPAELAEAESKNVVGQICGRLFDASGNQPNLALHRRLVSIELKDLAKIKTNVIVATGPEKATALAAAVYGGLVQVLIVDTTLAECVLLATAAGRYRPGDTPALPESA